MENPIDLFVDAMTKEVLNRVRDRVREELFPKVEGILNEEVCRYAIDLTKFYSVDRIGQDVRIVLHRVGYKNEA